MCKNMSKQTIRRKKDHIRLCLEEDVNFKTKTNGFENYDFEHNAITDVDINKIDLATNFFGKKISLPFMISSMIGGTSQAEKINEKLTIAARELNIPIGVGSQRQALESSEHYSTYKVVRMNAGCIPVLGNIGAAQVIKSYDCKSDLQKLIDLIEADALIIHANILQELVQPEGEPNFHGFIKKLDKVIPKIKIPIIVKEVGCGISKQAAKKLLDTGISGIDVAGSGGTSWGKVEFLRKNEQDDFLSDWGLATSYCVRTVKELKKDCSFILIGSGGINTAIDTAKALALGADMAASAKTLLQEVVKNDSDGVIKLIKQWFLTVKRIMLLTGCSNIKQFQNGVLKRKEEII
jgi:isopentenyl-diphosphate Delta-isomerase